jgi:transposase
MRPQAYREHNRVERFFNKLKHFRRIATRYDKLADSFLALVHLVSVFIFARNSWTLPSDGERFLTDTLNTY